MKIVSKPYTQHGRDEHDRIFGKEESCMCAYEASQRLKGTITAEVSGDMLIAEGDTVVVANRIKEIPDEN